MTILDHMVDKICMVTGSTSGIGAAAARELSRLGASVIVAGRSAGKLARQVERIKRLVPDARLDVLVADLSSQKQVRQLAEEFKRRYARLDVLINNAGAVFARREETADGLEITFALNHLSYFLLTNLLLDRLKASSSARIVVVSSAAHEQARINFDHLQAERHYNRLEAYAQSKLANLLFTYELARRLGDTTITVNALHPGSVATNLGSNNNWLKTRLRNLLKPGMISPEQGAKTLVYLATSPEVVAVTGQYFYNCRPMRSSEESYDKANAEKLWLLSERLSGFHSETSRAQN